MTDITTTAQANAILNGLSKRAAACTSNHELSQLAREAGTASAFLYESYNVDRWMDIMEIIEDINPWMRNFDDKGNWTGAVANENGWTP